MYEPVKTFYMGSNPGEAPFITKVNPMQAPQLASNSSITSLAPLSSF